MFNLINKTDDTLDHLLKSCEYFDLIEDTSTGELIIIMLRTLEMDVDICIRKYLEMTSSIFSKEEFLFRNKFDKMFKEVVESPRFSSQSLEKTVKELVEIKFESTRRDVVLEATKSHANDHSCKS